MVGEQMTVSHETNEALWEMLFDPRRRSRSVAKLVAKARGGDPSAQWFYSQWLSWDAKRGFQPMKGNALKWLRHAADGGHPDALLELGHIVCAHSRPDGMRLYERAAEAGNALAHWTMGLELESEGNGKALRSALAHFQACAAELPACAWKYAEFEYFGVSGKKNMEHALRLFRRAARTGESPEAETYLGLAAELGTGVAKNLTRARRWYARAAANPYSLAPAGDPVALLRLANLYRIQGNSTDACDAAERAAAAGLPCARVLAAQLQSSCSGSDARLIADLRKAIAADGEWKTRIVHWRAIDAMCRKLMREAKQMLRASRGNNSTA